MLLSCLLRCSFLLFLVLFVDLFVVEAVKLIHRSNLVDNQLCNFIKLLAFRIIGFTEEINSSIIEESAGRRFLLLVIDSDGDAAIASDRLHARDICLSICDIDHVLERNGFIFIRHGCVDFCILGDFKNALVDTIKELRLCRIVDNALRPDSNAVAIEIFACIYFLKIRIDRRAFDDFLVSGGDDIVLDFNTSFFSVFIKAFEPGLNTREILNVFS